MGCSAAASALAYLASASSSRPMPKKWLLSSPLHERRRPDLGDRTDPERGVARDLIAGVRHTRGLVPHLPAREHGHLGARHVVLRDQLAQPHVKKVRTTMSI
jgi:hypothetical protein